MSDSNGAPVANLRISGYNELTTIEPQLDRPADPLGAAPAAATDLRFVAAVPSRISLSVSDLRGRKLSTLFDAILKEGPHVVVWNSNDEAPPGVYKCRLVASDTLTSEMLYDDAVYAVKWEIDPERSVYGYTDASGVYQTTNDLLFPNVIPDLPRLVQTNVVGQEIGTFNYEDTVVVTLTDTLSNETMRVRRVVEPGENTFSVIWAPDARWNNPRISGVTAVVPNRPQPVHVYDTDPPVFEWSLEQNYPNPFN
ncbi:MAG: hypothetical protein P8181_06165 [bacterium]